MSLFGKLVSSAGIGQSEILGVFHDAIERVGKLPITTEDMRKGICIAFSAMLDELRAADVINEDTHKSALGELKEWNEGGEKKT